MSESAHIHEEIQLLCDSHPQRRLERGSGKFNVIRRVLIPLIISITIVSVIIAVALTPNRPDDRLTVGPKTTTFFPVSGSYFGRATLAPTGTSIANHTRLYSCPHRPRLDVKSLINTTLPGYDELYQGSWTARYLFLNARSSVSVSFCAPQGLRVQVYFSSADIHQPLRNRTSLLQNVTISAENCSGSTPNGHLLIEAKKDGPYQFLFLNDYIGTDFVVKYVYNITIRGLAWQYDVDDCLNSCVPNLRGSFNVNCSLSIPFSPSAGVIVSVGSIPGYDVTDKIGEFLLKYKRTGRLWFTLIGVELGALGLVALILYQKRISARSLTCRGK